MVLKMKYPITVIGDVHGKIDLYWKILNKVKSGSSIQVGDFGFRKHHTWHLKNIADNHKVLFGNHDDYTFLNEKHSLGNYTIINSAIMVIRGGFSIDRSQRIFGIDYFSNEELNCSEQNDIIEVYERVKPKIVITHESPKFLVDNFVSYVEAYSNTCRFLQYLYEVHQPDLWIFGHYHTDYNKIIDKTNFICLAELSTYEIKDNNSNSINNISY